MTRLQFETVLVVALFFGYAGLWQIKRARQKRRTGVDPEVLGSSGDPIQVFFARATKALTAFAAVIIVAHAMDLHVFPWLQRDERVDGLVADGVGISVGLGGLAICWIAQTTMGDAWRVGIDETHRPGLVKRGIYRWIRNPTYLGLFLVNIGFFLIWPTPLVAGFVLLFYLLLEVQVRCEEKYLIGHLGEEYLRYSKATWRYLPWVY